ncbi:hypothetical protein DER45DRAFT_641211 [Fusarium avenaceum]|nr:hypothetical protein DER45DRAFT_641211 [Fusarium avenaceum]
MKRSRVGKCFANFECPPDKLLQTAEIERLHVSIVIARIRQCPSQQTVIMPCLYRSGLDKAVPHAMCITRNTAQLSKRHMDIVRSSLDTIRTTAYFGPWKTARMNRNLQAKGYTLHLRGQSAKVASSGHLFQFSRPRSAESPDDIPTPCSHSDDLASAAQGYQVDSQPGLLVSARVGTCCGRKINSIQYIPMRINGWAVGPQQRYTHKTLRLGFSRCWRCAV